MRFRTLGRRPDATPGPGVSTLCLGAMPFGTHVDEATAFAILDRFVERGGTFVDTANCYSFWEDGGRGGESEELVGRWMTARGNRDRIVLATKVGAQPTGPGDWPGNAEGLSAKAIRGGVEGSLRRLGTDRVDVLYGHIEDRATPLAETVGAFGELVAEGTVRILGVSNQVTWRIERARTLAREHGLAGYSCIQQQYTYLRPKPGAAFGTKEHVTPELLDYVRAEPDLTLLAYTPLLSGAYTDPAKSVPEQFDHPGAAAQLTAVREVAAETGATAGQVVLAWLLGGELPIIPIIGASSTAQLDESLDALDLDLTPSQRDRLDQA
ncbi:aldo/keto reductase [Streptomyces sp. SID13666]|uniref:aldo/keto reductase n=1 Tax=unclassified Streptomyces TaxID=2593676 RepID=UPI0013C1CF55|nr:MULTISPECIES: aldo/keto reductase [unclassified Streptomyces]NEA52674.1 aldo/keto reductase [Streptomyces sp. SID13666]NEA69999.1 aldo/keto reductase [Streptomyces sp. SID13588]